MAEVTQPNPTHSERGATFDFWQEPSGYWSAKVIVRVPRLPDWVMAATAFHDANEALEWCRQQMFMAVDNANV